MALDGMWRCPISQIVENKRHRACRTTYAKFWPDSWPIVGFAAREEDS